MSALPRCLHYREVSIKRESTVFVLSRLNWYFKEARVSGVQPFFCVQNTVTLCTCHQTLNWSTKTKPSEISHQSLVNKTKHLRAVRVSRPKYISHIWINIISSIKTYSSWDSLTASGSGDASAQSATSGWGKTSASSLKSQNNNHLLDGIVNRRSSGNPNYYEQGLIWTEDWWLGFNQQS